MKKISVTGRNHGKIQKRLLPFGVEPLHCDITDIVWVRKELERVKPDVIIHAAAMTNVDECWKNYEQAIQVNFRGTNIVCEAASDVIGEGRVLLLSTDHVFDGKKGNYKETDKPNPAQNENYGLTKLAAEEVVDVYEGKTVRLSKGVSAFDDDVAQLLMGGNKTFPTFIKRSYCHLDFLAEQIYWCADHFDEIPEILHLGGGKVLSSYEFAKMVGNAEPRDYEIEGFAPRPFKCGLNTSLAKSLGIHIPSPEETVERLMAEI